MAFAGKGPVKKEKIPPMDEKDCLCGQIVPWWGIRVYKVGLTKEAPWALLKQINF